MARGCTTPYLGPALTEGCSASSYLYFMSLVDVVIRSLCDVSYMCERVTPRGYPDLEYDFIVIGGGSGGATAAGRLSEVPGWKVLLVEAGIDEPVDFQVPTIGNVFKNSSYVDWQYNTEPEPVACQANSESRCSWPRAKMLGGCSATNGMMYGRGTPADYDSWEADGNEGWGYEDVLPWLKYSEDNLDCSGGPMTVKRFNHQPEFLWDILKAAEELGYSVRDDVFGGENVTGFAVAQATLTKEGARLSAARAFLSPARNRPNLHVMINSTVTRILLSSDGTKTVEGVEFVYNDQTYHVRATKEVILAAGAINSPQLLLLSGIGPKEVLSNVGITQVHELPGVGRNLTNHVSFSVSFELENVMNVNILDERTLAQYILERNGPFSSTGLSQLTARINTKHANPDGSDPDLQFLFGGFDQHCSQGSVDGPQNPDDPDARRRWLIAPVNLHPKSRGYVTLKSSDPFDAPIMVANYLTEPEDFGPLIEGVRIARTFVDSPTLVSKFGIRLVNQTYGNCSDLYRYDSDDYWRCAIGYSTIPENHQASTCRMGPATDKFAVVDNKLRAYGIKGLRIADASVMPRVISGNLHSTVVMIAERAVDFIKSSW